MKPPLDQLGELQHRYAAGEKEALDGLWQAHDGELRAVAKRFAQGDEQLAENALADCYLSFFLPPPDDPAPDPSPPDGSGPAPVEGRPAAVLVAAAPAAGKRAAEPVCAPLGYDAGKPWFPWAKQILRNRLIDLLRQELRRDGNDPKVKSVGTADPAPPPARQRPRRDSAAGLDLGRLADASLGPAAVVEGGEEVRKLLRAFRQCLRTLKDKRGVAAHRVFVHRRLHGRSFAELAAELGVSERTVRRIYLDAAHFMEVCLTMKLGRVP